MKSASLQLQQNKHKARSRTLPGLCFVWLSAASAQESSRYRMPVIVIVEMISAALLSCISSSASGGISRKSAPQSGQRSSSLSSFFLQLEQYLIFLPSQSMIVSMLSHQPLDSRLQQKRNDKCYCSRQNVFYRSRQLAKAVSVFA